MTMPNERTYAVVRAREFLERLLTPYGGGIKGVPKAVREEARRVLRHFPYIHELKIPEMFDQEVIDNYYEKLAAKWDADFGRAAPVGPAGDEGEPGKSADS